MRFTAPLVLLLLAAAGARAQAPMTAQAFEAMVEGRTLHLSLQGRPYGAEQFFPGRRTLWRLGEEGCEPGRWYPEGDAICFVYETLAGPDCWRFLPSPGGGVAALVEGGVETGFRLDLERVDEAPLPCPGPEVGS